MANSGSGDDGLVGRVIASQFRVLKKIGGGGMGSVFLAEQIEMERKVVVKILHPELTAGGGVAMERFRREAKAVAQLNHPNIVQVFVFGQAEGGQMYLAMEYIEGRDLSRDLAQGPMAAPRALRILDQCCAALIEAHGAGIVHRDLKPENIMLADRHGNPDYVKVLDFGIAKLHDQTGENPTLTQAGSVFGTPRYMSPEQVKGEPVDARSDIYALGLILYEMLVGRHPFTAANTIDFMLKHVNEPVAAPSADGLDIAPRIEGLLLKCLEKDPGDRFQSVAELQREVRVALRDFSEAVRGFPSGSVAPVGRSGGIPRPTAGTQPPGLETYHPPGSRPGGTRRGISPWIWAVIALLLVGGIVGIVVAVAPTGGGGGAGRTALLAGGGGDDGATPDKGKAKDPGGGPATVEARDADAGSADRDVDDGDAKVVAKSGGDHEEVRDTGASEPPPPTTALEEGPPIEGFPVPKDVKLLASTPQAEVFETSIGPRDAIAFYKAKLHGRYRVGDVPNGLMIEGPDTPFSYVTFTPYADRFNMVLTRNALAPLPTKPAGPPPPAFGVEFPDDATLVMRSEQAVSMRTRKPFDEVCAFYEKQLGDIKGVMVMRDDKTPSCTVAASMAEGTPWLAVAVVNDPMSSGALLISVVPRQ